MTRTFHSVAVGAAAVALFCSPNLIPEPTDGPKQRSAGARAAGAPGACPGRPIKADRVITGEFGTDLARSFVMLPFDVPAGTTAVRVKYCFDQPDIPISTPLLSARHTLDLGLYEPRADAGRTWGVPEFRGWGGSSHPDVTVSAEGFSSEADYAAKPRREVAGKTTRAFRPGPIEAGRWAVELGVAGVVPRTLGDADGKVAWRVEIELPRERSYADEPYRPAPYSSAPARRGRGWYAGDMHVHAEHSAYGDATMREALDYAYRPLSRGGAGLDFVTLSDYVSGSAWGEVGRHQPRYPGKLVARSAEVITYRGHLNNHATAKVVDYREGPIYERAANGALKLVRGSRDPAQTFADIKAAGGFTQINHPTIFPSSIPLFDLACRGCSWEYSAAETDYRRADAIEIATGPDRAGLDGTPNPFTVTAIDFYERALHAGSRAAAVGVSDSHNAGRAPNALTQSPIGTATTVVRAEELSEPGIECGVEAGHTYVKVTGNDGPDIRFEARSAPLQYAGATMGDTLKGNKATFRARVIGGAGRTLLVIRDGAIVRAIAITKPDQVAQFADSGHGRYRLQLMRGIAIETVSTPIWFTGGRPQVITRDCTPLSVRGKARRRVRPGRKGAFLTRCGVSGGDARSCEVTAEITTGRKGRRRTRVLARRRISITRESRRVRLVLTRYGRRVARKHRRGRALRLRFVASDGDGATAALVRRSRLLRPR